MIQFGESTIRLASVARQAGHSAAAINELWHEVRLRGLLAAGRLDEAADAAEDDMPDATGVAPQWRAIERVTAAEIYRARGDNAAAAGALVQSIATAETFRLPHQVQRAVRAARGSLPQIEEAGTAALERLRLSLPLAQPAPLTSGLGLSSAASGT